MLLFVHRSSGCTSDLVFELRKTHVNLFLYIVMSSFVSAGLAIIMFVSNPRLPAILPSVPVGIVFLIVTAMKMYGCTTRKRLIIAKIGLVWSLVTKCCIAGGLFIGYGTITASLDRPWLYLASALVDLPSLREPYANPMTSQ